MSLLVTGLVWKHADVDKGTLLVLLAMADIAEDDGSEIWPSMARLAKKSRLDMRQCRRCLRILETEGLIEPVETATGRGGRFKSWRINLEKVILSNPGGFDVPVGDRSGNRKGGQNVRQTLSTGQNLQNRRTFLPPPADISDSVLENGPVTVLEQSSTRDAGAAEGADAARVKWAAVRAGMQRNRFLKHFGAVGVWKGAEAVAIADGELVVEIDSSYRFSQIGEVRAEAERWSGMPIKFVLSAEAQAKLPRRA